MVLNLIAGHILLLILPLCIVAFFIWLLFYKLKWNEKLWGLAIIPGLVTWFYLWSAVTLDLIVVNKDLTSDRYMVLFSCEYESEDGQVIQVKKTNVGKFMTADVFIVNTSETDLTIETVDYGKSYMRFARLLTPPDVLYSHRTLYATSVPDYFPDEFSPGSVRVNQAIEGTTKKWLRRARSDESALAKKENELLVPVK